MVDKRSRGLSLVELLIVIAGFGAVSLLGMSLLTGQQKHQNSINFQYELLHFHQEVRAHLTSTQACSNTFNGITLNGTTNVSIDNILNDETPPATITTKYAKNTPYASNLVKISSIRLSNYNAVANTADVTIQYAPTKAVVGAQVIPKTITLNTTKNASNHLTACHATGGSGSGGPSSELWQKAINPNDIFFDEGKVGIGTSTPITTLEVAGGVKITSNHTLLTIGERGATSTFNRNSSTGAGPLLSIVGSNSLTTNSDATISFHSSSGNAGWRAEFGLFRNYPMAKLKLMGGIWVEHASTWVDYEAFSYDPQAQRLTVPSHVDLAPGGVVKIGTSAYGGNTTLLVRGYPGRPDVMSVTDSNGSPLIHVTNAGNVGIRTANSNYPLHVNGTAAKPGGGSWTDSSDIRLKKNIAPLEGALDKLLQLKPVTYEWIHPEAHKPGQHAGFIAQEVEQVFPTWVSESDPPVGDEALIPAGEKSKSLTFPHDFNAYVVKALGELVAWIRESDTEKDSRIKNLERKLEEMTAWTCSKDPSAPFCN